MKKILIALIVAALTLGGCTRNTNQPFHPNHSSSIEAKASHMIAFHETNDDGDDESVDICTGTVIGPHAILTADHCNPGDKMRTIELDYSTFEYHIGGEAHDGRDHVIYLLDGPEFKDIAPVKIRQAKIGERVYIYGYGKEKYPAVIKTGVVLNEYDPSEVDARAGLVYTSIPCIPGDSGSAVYAEDGSIVAVVTYQFSEDYIVGTEIHSGDFALDFPDAIIVTAQTFGAGEVLQLKTAVVHVSAK